ncbi:putative ABC Methanesulfonate (MSA) transporter, periplasmic protein [Candidatus Filomicrobium marinum]|uniref:Putative ABC MSA transporter periplasmic protein n=1 Tax=Candidatus Filomicrobium marinum TaxID=1608628 RepID=A0A0D6JH45_9HYPH|nr:MULTISPECIES: nitrate ABC transporter substrate-binding protein [Filomicrobium]AIY69292.1 putative ABC MSA transporter periplasmic protein [Candidatus Filomicrobium marinum]MCV0369915.1 nitrate ABC transporter substrate-binding protein [Filomicrobium sp.]CFX53706.1 putative ABC Methanesulfonate (MSA) transporter, periplasmic protein [Candidatus Filomicrobium marinum]CPR19909.1 putative ABC Methanesulfonate (MSA) transporter, periplasmic protein [Candidatus Filomicrobium marinum]
MKLFAKSVTSAALASAAMLLASAPSSADVQFGKAGEPVNLVVGYQPYYTGSWSGIVVNGKELWKKYLPEGSTADFQVGLQGAVIVNAMTGEKQHIGYVGDMPAIAATFRNLPNRGGTDIRIVSTLGTSKQQCNIFLVRNDAPEFKSGTDAVKWMDGKTISAPFGACTDRFARRAFDITGIKPKRYLNQSIEVITTNFTAKKLDAAAIWEPTASKIELKGIARRVASGEDFDIVDGGFMVMLNDLIQQRPDVVKGWLNAELDAQLFLADLNNADAVSKMAEQQTEQIDRKILWAALYGGAEPQVGQTKIRLDFVATDRVKKLLDDATAYLYSLPQKPAAEEKIRPDAMQFQFAEELMKERGLSAPLGEIKTRPMSDFKQ